MIIILIRIYKKLVNEEETSTVEKTTYSKSEVQQMKRDKWRSKR